MKRAVFLDRDGVLNRQVGYVNKPEDLQLFPGVPYVLRKLRELDYQLIVISNQAGVSYGYLTEADLDAITEKLHAELAAEDAYLNAVYYCTHALKAQCHCRKPEPGQFFHAALLHDLHLPSCFFIGDIATDIRAGHNACVQTILVKTGRPEDLEPALAERPDFVAANLFAAYEWIKGQTP